MDYMWDESKERTGRRNGPMQDLSDDSAATHSSQLHREEAYFCQEGIAVITTV